MNATAISELMGQLAELALRLDRPMDALLVLEKRILEGALAMAGGNQVHTARWLGWHRNTVTRRMILLGIPRARESRKKVA